MNCLHDDPLDVLPDAIAPVAAIVSALIGVVDVRGLLPPRKVGTLVVGAGEAAATAAGSGVGTAVVVGGGGD